MATHACIAIRLRDIDKGKTISFNKKLLPPGYKVNIPDSDLSRLTITIPENATSISIASQFDGYIGHAYSDASIVMGVGMQLHLDFKTYEQVLNLMTLGKIISLDCDEKSDKDFKFIDIALAHKGYTPTNPIFEFTTDERVNASLLQNMHYNTEYNYVFTGNHWWYCKCGEKSLHDLATTVNQIRTFKKLVA
ncbi:MAG: hypothetical protein MJ237_05955 [bacterium]|nr:hypothetical protein [bacterium]